MATIYDIVDNGTLFVQVGSDGTIETNPDPSDPSNSWTVQTSGTLKHLYGVEWNGAVFVAVGQDGVSLVSSDAITWTTITNGNPVTDLNAISSAANVFIAVGNAGVIVSSQNGYSWDTITSGTTENLWGVVIANAIYTAVGDNSTIVTGAVVSTQLRVILGEGVGYNENLLAPGSTFNLSGIEALQVDEGTGGGLNVNASAVRFATSSENLVMLQSGVETGISAPVVTDTTGIADRAWQPFAELLESFTVSDVASQLGLIIRSVSENVTLNDAVLLAEVQQIIEAITVADTMVAAGSVYNPTLSESVSLISILRFAWNIIETENINVSDLEVIDLQIARSIAETLAVSGVVPTQQIANEVVAVAIIFNDIAEKYFDRVAVETLTINDTAFNLWRATVAAIETVTVNDSVTDSMVITLIVSDDVLLTDPVNINQVLSDTLVDGFNFAVSFTENGESYTGWVMNTDTFAVSKYLDYNFNSMCRFNGSFFASSPLGIYELAGADDAGVDIDAIMKTRVMSFGSKNLKRVTNAYVGYKADGTMLLKTIADGKERWYTLSPSDTTNRHNARVKLGRGVKSAYWQFELTNVNGADFSVESLELLPVILSRKV